MARTDISVVHFTETFLASAKDILDEDDLKRIVLQLSADSSIGTPVEGVPHLRQINQFVANSSALYAVWYLAFPDAPHIEVIGLSKSEDDHGSLITKRTIWRIVKLSFLLRSIYRAYKFGTDHMENIL